MNAAPGRSPALRGVFANREFRAVWASFALSAAGDRLAVVAVTLLVYARTRSPLLAAVAYASATVPYLAGGLFLGGLADRLPRRSVMIGCDLVRAVLAAVMVLPGMPLPALIAVLYAVTAAQLPFDAARAATVEDIFDGEAYFRAMTVTQVTFRLVLVAGAAAGGLAVGLAGPRPAIAVDAVTFVASALLIRLAVRPRPGTAPHAAPSGRQRGHPPWQGHGTGDSGSLHLSYRLRVSTVEESPFSAWSLLSLTSTAQGVLAYPDELGVRYVYDTAVPNSRHVTVGDLAVIRDNRDVLGAGWIDSIEVTSARKIRYRCPNCGSTDFKFRSRQQPAYRCAQCAAEFDIRNEEELSVQVFTANYSRTYRPADRPFPVKALDPAYVTRSQQNAIRRLEPTALRPLLDSHLVTGEPWWETHVREEERIPGGHSAGLSKTRVGQQRFREAMLDRFGEACAFTGPQPPGALEAAHLYLYSKNPEHDLGGGLLLRCDLHALFDRWLITIDPDTWAIQIAPELKRYPGLAELDGKAVQLTEDLRPRLKYVQEHAALTRASWARPPSS